MGFKYLTHVHARWHTQRIQNDIHWLTLLVIRHVFFWHNNGNNTLVTVTASHLVTRLDGTFDCQIHFHNLKHARRQIVALSQLSLLVFKPLIQINAALGQLGFGALELLIHGFVRHAQFEPVLARKIFQIVVSDLLSFLQLRSTGYNFSYQRLL